MLKMMNLIITLYNSYFDGWAFPIVFLLCLAFLIFTKSSVRDRRPFGLLTAVLILIISCPIVAKVLVKLIGYDVYWRIYWLIPVVPVLALTFTELAFRWKGAWKKYLTILICAAVVAINGKCVFTQGYYTNRTNVYKLSDNVIAVADAINEHAKEHKIKKKKIVAPSYVATYIRVYDASILQKYGRFMVKGQKIQSLLYAAVNSDEPDFRVLYEKSNKAKCRYVVLNRDADNPQEMEVRNFEKIFENDRYVVYFNLRFDRGKKE